MSKEIKFSFAVEKQCPFSCTHGDSDIWNCVLDDNHHGEHIDGYNRKSSYWFKLDKQWMLDNIPK